MMSLRGVSRRTALQLGFGGVALPLVHIRTADAAGKLTIAFWDHWVPNGNAVMQRQVNAWASPSVPLRFADGATNASYPR